MSNPSEQALNGAAEERLALTATLNQLSEINRYNRWIYDQFSACLGQRILEVGSGTGNITQFLLTGNRTVVATDVLPKYRQELTTRFPDNQHLQIRTFDLDRTVPAEFIAHPFDTVVCLNVLEHIEDDRGELQKVYETLESGGHCLIFVPALMWLYGAFDEKVGHFRRYTKNELEEKGKAAGFKIVKSKYFDFVGIFPWYIKYKLLKSASLESGAVTAYDKFAVPVTKQFERFLKFPVGKNILTVLQK